MEKKPRYYSRLLLFSTVIFSIVVFLLSTVTYLAFQRVNLLEKKHSYDETLIKLESQIAAKQDDFHKVYLPFYDTRNQPAWNRFLSNDIENLSYEDRIIVNNLLKNVCLQDNDIRALIIARLDENRSYIFTRDNNELTEISKNISFCQDLFNTSMSRKIYGTRNLLLNSGKSSESREDVYMISGGIFKNDKMKNAVKVGICYAANMLGESIGISTEKNTHSLFGIVTSDNKSLYSSDGNYKVSSLNNTLFDNLKKKEVLESREDPEFLIQSQFNKQRNYLVFYKVSSKYLSGIPTNEKLLLSGTAIVSILLVSVLSIISNYLMKKRMGDLVVGMEEIGNNNLEYRIPIDKKNDEFTEIAVQFNTMSERLLFQIQQTYAFEVEKRSSEFRAMQSIINPHFLYNTLETIRELLDRNGEEDGAEMVVILSELMKYQIRGGSIATIGEELQELQSYISLLSLRYDGEFQYEMKIDDAILLYKIPKYTLQPVLENYFVHGYKTKQDNKFWIEGYLRENEIIFNIIDNGSGISADDLVEIQEEINSLGHSKIGLSNVHNRLRLAFGDSYGIEVKSVVGRGTTVIITLPAVMNIEEISIGKDIRNKNERYRKDYK